MHLLSYSIIAFVTGFVALIYVYINSRETEGSTINQSGNSTANPAATASAESYDFHHPDKVYLLPPELKEISGIAMASQQMLYCIQDEMGIVYQFDLHKGEVTGTMSFGEAGDYEDLAIVNGEIYVLRSDATIFRFNKNRPTAGTHYDLSVSCTDVEGLFYHASENSFYLTCKNGEKKGDTKVRNVYQLSQSNMVAVQTFFTIDLHQMQEFMSHRNESSDKGKFQFNPSGLAAHPLSGDLYILSASGRYLAVFKEEELKNVFTLPGKQYLQPEGIAFDENGNLFIASEGSKDGKHRASIIYLRTR